MNTSPSRPRPRLEFDYESAADYLGLSGSPAPRRCVAAAIFCTTDRAGTSFASTGSRAWTTYADVLRVPRRPARIGGEGLVDWEDAPVMRRYPSLRALDVRSYEGRRASVRRSALRTMTTTPACR